MDVVPPIDFEAWWMRGKVKASTAFRLSHAVLLTTEKLIVENAPYEPQAEVISTAID